MAFWQMCLFNLKLHIKNSYFVNLVLLETTLMMLYQYLGGYEQHHYHGQEWLVAGILGAWASCTTAAGALNFQRRQGTLIYLLNTVKSPLLVFLAVIIPASIFGSLAYPLAWLESWLLHMTTTPLEIKTFLGMLLFWIVTILLSYLISFLFILTPHALAYEKLLFLPILLISGLLTIPSQIAWLIRPLQILSPLNIPIKLIYGQQISLAEVGILLLVVTGIIFLALKLTNIIITRALKLGTIEVL